ARSGVDAERRQRDRARHVAHVLQRRQRLRHRLGDRRLPLPARDPRPRTQRPTLQEGGLMTAAAEAVVIPKPRDNAAARIVRMAAKGPVNIVLLVIGLLWLVPTLG